MLNPNLLSKILCDDAERRWKLMYPQLSWPKIAKTSLCKQHVKLTWSIHFLLTDDAFLDVFFLFLIMADVHTCQNLSNFHIVNWWSNRGPASVTQELLSLTDRCPPGLKGDNLRGVLAYGYFRETMTQRQYKWFI